MKKNYNENLVAGAAIRDDKGRRISKLFEGSHPKMTVGYAKNLIMPDEPTEQEFNFRQSGGGLIEDGVAVIDKVKGNSVVWNQLMKFGASTKTDNGITYEIKEDGRVHIYGTATARSTVTYYNSIGVIISGHKYIIVSANNIISGEANGRIPAIETQGGITTCNQSDANPVWYFRVQNGVTIDVTFRPQLIDVTQMFGAGNEPATYEEFLQRKPKVADEYAYNEGTIVNNKVEGCRTVGFNQFNPNVETEYLSATGQSGSERYVKRFKALPGTYFLKSVDKGNVYAKSVTNGVYSTPHTLNKDNEITLDSYGEIWVYSETEATINGVANDICINLSDPTINGKYFPYEEHSLDLSWVKEIKDGEGAKLFEDGMRSAGTVFDEVGKNKAIKRIGVKVFDGTESFTDYLAIYGSFAIMRDAFAGVGSFIGISNRYVVSRLWESDPDRTKYDKQIYIDSINNRVWIRDSAFADVDSLKQYLAGLYAAGTPLVLYYELAEPIEVEYDEKSLTYPVVAGGTEEAIASEPSSAFRADIGYGIDAVKTILDLKARVAALEGK